MTDASFEKVSHSEQPLFGPRKLLLCGFGAGAQSNFCTLLEMLGLTDLPRVWATDEQAGVALGRLMALENGSGQGEDSSLPRAVIMAGITEKELHRLMGGARKAGMRDALWATLTPVSENWTLGALLAELSAEREAMRHRHHD